MLDNINYNDHYTNYDGILGLGFMDENEDQAIMPQIMKQLDNPVFTIWLDEYVILQEIINTDFSRKENRLPGTFGGLLTFGGLNLDNCNNNWDFVNLTRKMDWPYEWRVDVDR